MNENKYKKEWHKSENGIGCEWTLKEKEINRDDRDDYVDFEKAGFGYMFLVLAFVVFVNSSITSLVFAGVVRTIALKANPAVNVFWLDSELQVLIAVAMVWTVVIQSLLIIVHGKIGRLVANG